MEDGYYDDFPPEVIKKYKLKVSEKIKDPAGEPCKRQKLSETSEVRKLSENYSKHNQSSEENIPEQKSEHKPNEANS